MPAALEKKVSSSSLSRTSNAGNYQAGDACFGEINKEANCWISPKGVSTDQKWRRVFIKPRLIDEGKEIYKLWTYSLLLIILATVFLKILKI